MGEKTMSGSWGEKTKEGIFRMLGDGADAHIHHKPGTIFDMARLFLTIHQEELHEQWLKEACDEAIAITRDSATRKFRNHKRAQARSMARKRQRRAEPLAAVAHHGLSQPENPGYVAPVAAEGSQAESKFWDAVEEVAKGR
jgi:hypothetical protein